MARQRQQRQRLRPASALVLGTAAFLFPARLFIGAARPSASGVRTQVVRQGMMDGIADVKGLEKMMKDPKMVEQIQKAAEELEKDPAKKKAFDEYNKFMASRVEKMKEDPELKEFFEDVQKNGLSAIAKYEKDEKVMRKFSQMAGGVPGMPPMPGMPGTGAPAAPAGGAFKPGDEVIISGLSKAPELNGKKAMVVPPTSDEKKKLDGTDRLIVRLLDTGDQFAVRPTNLKTTAQEVDDLMSKNLEDISMYNPSLQAEAAKLRESGKLEDLQNDPELKPIFEDIKRNGMGVLEKYWNDEKLMAKISKAMSP